MQIALTFEEIIKLVKATPEKAVFDWKTDFVLPNSDEKKGEFIKDLTAIANACFSTDGFIVYGVDPRRPDPVLGITTLYDDAKLQQLVDGKIEPRPEFLYYEVSTEVKTVGVLQIKPTHRRPHIIRVDLGAVRKGQIPIRRGSSTDGVTIQDLFAFFYGEESGYFPGVTQKLMAHAQQQQAHVAYLRLLEEQQNQALRDMEIVAGMPRSSLGARW